MKKMAAGVFKAKCLSVMDTVQRTREPVDLTVELGPAQRPVCGGKRGFVRRGLGRGPDEVGQVA